MNFLVRNSLVGVVLFTILGLPVQLAAQETQDHHQHHHHHYKLVDNGTFGGPQSYVFDGYGFFAPKVLTNHGLLAGAADTSEPDPFPNACFNPDCFVAHAFRTEEDGNLSDLGALPGDGTSVPLGTSASGLIVGISENGQLDPLVPGFPVGRAVLWQDGGITDLGVIEGGYESQANGVNSKGEIAGVFTNATPDANSMYGLGYQARAFFWQNGVMQDLGTLGTGTDAEAILINERGQVVGWSYVSSAQIVCLGLQPITLATDSFIWDKKNGMRDLGGLGGMCTMAADLNNRGQVVGFSDLNGDAVEHAFLWDGSIHDLGGSLGGQQSGAFAVNDAGEAVGFANLTGDTLYHAALWKHAGMITDLGVVGSDQCSYARSINSKVQVVGNSRPDCASDSGIRPFLWDDGSIFDLNTLIPPGSPLVLHFAQNINDRGEIVAYGVDVNGNGRTALLIPCDEDHSGVEGCDYDLVDATRSASPANAAVNHVYNRALTPAAVRKSTRFNIFPQSRFNSPGRVVGPRN
jgi:probable HAF family extracellular repeat protein